MKDLEVACILDRWYNLSLESTLQEIGFEHVDIKFISPVGKTNDIAAGSLPPADHEWAAQHVSVWRACASGDTPMLVFQEDVLFLPGCSNVLSATKALVAAVKAQTTGDDAQILLLGGTASGNETPSQVVTEGALVSARAVSQAAAYVLWPRAARMLLQSLPIDVPMPAFVSKHVADSGMMAFLATPALIEAAPG